MLITIEICATSVYYLISFSRVCWLQCDRFYYRFDGRDNRKLSWSMFNVSKMYNQCINCAYSTDIRASLHSHWWFPHYVYPWSSSERCFWCQLYFRKGCKETNTELYEIFFFIHLTLIMKHVSFAMIVLY